MTAIYDKTGRAIAVGDIIAAQKTVRCPKCNATSGDDWLQCRGKCPMPGSPHYSPTTAP